MEKELDLSSEELEDLKKEDTEYLNILKLLDNKTKEEEILTEEEEEKDEFELQALTDIIQ